MVRPSRISEGRHVLFAWPAPGLRQQLLAKLTPLGQRQRSDLVIRPRRCTRPPAPLAWDDEKSVLNGQNARGGGTRFCCQRRLLSPRRRSPKSPLPPCGGGLGWGVLRRRLRRNKSGVNKQTRQGQVFNTPGSGWGDEKSVLNGQNARSGRKRFCCETRLLSPRRRSPKSPLPHVGEG